MTKRETLTGIMMVSVADTIIDKTLIDLGIDGSEAYDKESKTEIDVAEYEILKLVVSRPDLSEGDLSIKQNLAGIKLRLQFLAKSLGKEDELKANEPAATISSPKVW